MKSLDLTWTGNQFLDPARMSNIIVSVVGGIDVTTKDDVWAEGVVAAIASHTRIPGNRIRAGAGATQLLDTILRGAYRGLIVDVIPNFHLTATLSAQQGWNYTNVPVREPDELLPALAPYCDRPEAVIVLCSPRNPLGYQFNVLLVEELLSRAQGLVVVDEVYADFAPDTVLHLVDKYPNLVVVRTFSKAWGLANLRIGYAVSASFANDEVPSCLMPNSVSGVAQRVARHLLDHPREIRDSIKEAESCREYLRDGLIEIRGLHVWPSDANYLCVEVSRARELNAALRAAGYKTRLLHDLRGYPEHWPTGLRVTVPPRSHCDTILACSRRVLENTAQAGVSK